MVYEIDASKRSLGRVAAEAASMLRGKNEPEFQRHIAPKIKVNIKNVSKLDIGAKKMRQKKYKRYSGYPGGLKEKKMEELIRDNGYSEIVRTAVSGMLPRNKLRKNMLKNLSITD